MIAIPFSAATSWLAGAYAHVERVEGQIVVIEQRISRQLKFIDRMHQLDHDTIDFKGQLRSTEQLLPRWHRQRLAILTSIVRAEDRQRLAAGDQPDPVATPGS